MLKFWELLGTVLLEDKLDKIIEDHTSDKSIEVPDEKDEAIKQLRLLSEGLSEKGFPLSRFEVSEVNRVLFPNLETSKNIYRHLQGLRKYAVPKARVINNIDIDIVKSKLSKIIIGMTFVDLDILNCFNNEDEKNIIEFLKSLNLGNAILKESFGATKTEGEINSLEDKIYIELIKLYSNKKIFGYPLVLNNKRLKIGILGVNAAGWERPGNINWQLPATCITGFIFSRKYVHFDFENAEVFPDLSKLAKEFMKLASGQEIEVFKSGIQAVINKHFNKGEFLKSLQFKTDNVYRFLEDNSLHLKNEFLDTIGSTVNPGLLKMPDEKGAKMLFNSISNIK